MAGVGFSLRALGTEDSYGGLLRQYGAAGIISSGPWLISILSLLFVGVLGRTRVPDPEALVQFQVSVTWLFAASLLVSGPLQLAFTRLVADLTYLRRDDSVLGQLLGAMGVTSALGALLCLALSPLFADTTLAYRVLLSLGFICLCDIWLALIVLSGLRAHGEVLTSFGLGYGITFVATLLLAPYGATGLLLGFLLGQASLLARSLFVIASKLPRGDGAAVYDAKAGDPKAGDPKAGARAPIGELDFLRPGRLRPELLLVGLLYNLGIWCDKLMFWLWPSTSHAVVGPFRASEVYDLPLFLAYLSIMPAMATFLVRVETDFAEQHGAFYGAIADGAPLARIEKRHAGLTEAARVALADIVKVQAITFLACLGAGPSLLSLAGISDLHLPLFYIDAAGVGLQVLLLAITSIFFYLDRRWTVAALALLLCVANAGLTFISQRLGPEFYGYGFAVAAGLTSACGLIWLDRTFATLVRDTFMRQRAVTP